MSEVDAIFVSANFVEPVHVELNRVIGTWRTKD